MDELNDSLLLDDRVNLLVLKRVDAATQPVRLFMDNHQASKVEQAIPEWMELLMTLYGGFRVHEILELYEIPK